MKQLTTTQNTELQISRPLGYLPRTCSVENECVVQNKYWQALESYNTALENTSSVALKLKVSLNRCRVLYKLGKADKCIEQAESVLKDMPQNPLAFLWIALAYTIKIGQQK